MALDQKTNSELPFSREEIFKQLDRIFLNHVFKKSAILRQFLLFVVEETCKGHSTWIKEYTIAVNVLNKPADFNTQENCIVRIHAGRLRRALNRYYNEAGAFDPLRITIPKGSYIPLLNEGNKSVGDVLKMEDSIPHSSDIIAVLPFHHVHKNAFEISLTDGLGLQLSSALMQIRHSSFSVIAYPIARSYMQQLDDNIGKFLKNVPAKYIVTGDIQTVGKLIRVFIQVIHTPTNKQLWSRMYDKEFTTGNIFELQDEIAGLILPELEAAFDPKKARHRKLVAAIA